METYIFPFRKIPRGSKVIIYGAGRVGQIYWQELTATKYCDVVAIADKDWKSYELLSEKVKVIRPEEISSCVYEYVIVAIKDNAICQSILNDLVSCFGVKKEKIVSDSPLPVPYITLPKSSRKEGRYSSKFAYESKKMSIAVFVGNGLGDIIIAKKYILEILRLAPTDCLLDLFGKAEFIEAVCSDIQQLHNIFPWNFYENQCHKYDLAIYATYLMSIDEFSKKRVDAMSSELSTLIQHLEKQLLLYGLSDRIAQTSNSVHFARCRYFSKNAYTAYTDIGGLKINDTYVPIPIVEAESSKFDNLELPHKKYITFHYGWGEISSENKKHAKVWLPEYFAKLAELIRSEYPDLCIVQVGGDNEIHLQGIDKALMGYSLELVKYILKNALLHVDCEGGLVHLATQLGTRCAVLFGPTPQWYFGYEENINISANVCPPCYYLEDNFASCIRRLDEPECMKALQPAMVMEKIREHIESEIKS